jgi:hypothetical protein
LPPGSHRPTGGGGGTGYQVGPLPDVPRRKAANKTCSRPACAFRSTGGRHYLLGVIHDQGGRQGGRHYHPQTTPAYSCRFATHSMSACASGSAGGRHYLLGVIDDKGERRVSRYCHIPQCSPGVRPPNSLRR